MKNTVIKTTADLSAELNTLAAALESKAQAYNEAALNDDFREMAVIDGQMKDLEKDYAEVSQAFVFTSLKVKEAPMLEAIKAYGFKVLKHKDSAESGSTIKTREIIEAERQFDLREFDAFCGYTASANKNWSNFAERMNMLCAIHVANALKVEDLASIGTSYFISKTKDEIRLAQENPDVANPISNTQMLNMLQQVLDKIIYEDNNGKYHPGYVDLLEKLETEYPLGTQIVGEQAEKDFIRLFGTILSMRNILSSFDQFAEMDSIGARDLQNYQSIYLDLYDKYRKKGDAEKEDITDDIEFEIELIKQVEINIDYILMLVEKYHEGNCEDKEILASIRKAVDASMQLRSKKELIEAFISHVNVDTQVTTDWRRFVLEQEENDLTEIITTEKLKNEETRKFVANAFRDGALKTTGTEIDKLMPPVSRFGGGGRAKKKQGVIEKLKAFFEKYFGLGIAEFKADEDQSAVHETEPTCQMVAEENAQYGEKK